jgi:hypothetical protein
MESKSQQGFSFGRAKLPKLIGFLICGDGEYGFCSLESLWPSCEKHLENVFKKLKNRHPFEQS